MTNTTNLSPASARTVDGYVTTAVRRPRGYLTFQDARADLLYALGLGDRDEALKALAAYGFINEGALRMGVPLARVYGELQGIAWPELRRAELAK